MILTAEQKLAAKPMPPFIRELRGGIRERRKTQTRRTNGLDERNKNPNQWIFKGMSHEKTSAVFASKDEPFNEIFIRNPYGVPGEIRYLREPIKRSESPEGVAMYWDDARFVKLNGELVKWKWKNKTLPQIHMPKRFARTFVEIKEVRIQRIWEMTEADAIAEAVAVDNGSSYKVAGHPYWAHATAKGCFETLFDHINGESLVKRNVWIWAVTFKLIE